MSLPSEDPTFTPKQNAKQPPAVYYARHMIPGVADYEDDGLYLTKIEALKLMCKTGVGVPVFVGHQPVSLATIKQDADGYVVESFFNPLDGWAWFKFIIVDDKAHDAIAKGDSVSNCFLPLKVGAAGQHINLNYDKEILDAKFTHLAIVPDPRYEDSKIYTEEAFKQYQDLKRSEFEELKNSKDSHTKPKGTKKMNIFRNKREAIDGLDEDALVEMDGKEVSMKELMNSKKAADAANAKVEALEKELKNAKAKKNTADSDDDGKADASSKEKENSAKCMVNGKETDVPMKDLISCYENSMKKNEKDGDDEDDKEKENSESDADENAKDDEEKDKEKKNSKGEKPDHFKELMNARNTVSDNTVVETSAMMLSRGKSRYGSAE